MAPISRASAASAASVADGKLIVLLARHQPPPFPVHLVLPSARSGTAKQRAFVAFAAPRLRQRLLIAAGKSTVRAPFHHRAAVVEDASAPARRFRNEGPGESHAIEVFLRLWNKPCSQRHAATGQVPHPIATNTTHVGRLAGVFDFLIETKTPTALGHPSDRPPSARKYGPITSASRSIWFPQLRGSSNAAPLRPIARAANSLA
jgi:hypothetical protein